MSASSGIAVSEDLTATFAAALESQGVRFLKIAIRNETLVVDHSVPPSGTIDEDLHQLQNILEDDVPAYILARLDNNPAEWLAISYVPDAAKVRDKMLYASSRSNLTRQLGATHFADNLFANSKEDITPDAYKKHKQYNASPAPMNAREQEMAEIKAAERAAVGVSYDRLKTPHGQSSSYVWSEEVKDAISALPTHSGSHLVIITIQVDTQGESLSLTKDIDCTVDEVRTLIPASVPAFAFFYWNEGPRKDIVFIYSCPSSSSVKYRMVYSTGALAVHRDAKAILGGSASFLVDRKIETSNPEELDETFIADRLGHQDQSAPGFGTTTPQPENLLRSRPKAPGRKR